MKAEIIEANQALTYSGIEELAVPQSIADAGDRARIKFIEFFTATIRNPNTRAAYGRAVARFFCWCQDRRIQLHNVAPVVVAAFIEELGHTHSKPTVKQNLAAIRMLFDWFVVSQVVLANPAAPVRGPKHVVKRGKTPVLSAQETRQLLDSIDCTKIGGLRDRALIAVMVFSFARISAVVAMNIEDYYPEGKRWWMRLHEKGGKQHLVPAHHTAEEYLDAYVEAAGFPNEKKSPLFRTLNVRRCLTDRRISRHDAVRMIKRRARAAQLPTTICCHTFRATGITAYLDNGGTIENAQAIAAHESPRTTKLYDRTGDEITLDEIERISI